MHFIGMLAFNLCTVVDYDPGTTLLSVLPSLGASCVALAIISRSKLTTATLLTGGLLVGAGIGAMHYTGMAAMQMDLALRYDPAMFALSIVVAVVLATLALWIRFGLRNLRGRLHRHVLGLISASVMGCAIAGMHYTGMAAARFVGRLPPGAVPETRGTFLALAITLITVAITIFIMSANGMLRYRELFRQKSESESWMRALLTTTIDGCRHAGKAGRRHAGVVHAGDGAAHHHGRQRAEEAGTHMLAQGTHAEADPDRQRGQRHGHHDRQREHGRVVLQVKIGAHGGHAGVVHGADAGAGEHAPGEQRAGGEFAPADDVERHPRGAQAGQHRQHGHAGIVLDHGAQVEGQHADEVHGPHAAAQRQAAGGQHGGAQAARGGGLGLVDNL